MTPFRYETAADAAAAVRLGAGAGAKYLGGGTNLVDLMRETIERPDLLVDVSGLDGEIRDEGDGGLMIGAAAKNTAVAADRRVRERFPMLAQAILAGASGQIRNMATIGGNIMQRTRCIHFFDDAARCNKREPGAGCDALEGFNRNHAILGASPDCAATHPSDMCVALAALDATVRIEGPTRARDVPIVDFHRLPGGTPHIETTLQPGDLITAVLLGRNGLARRSSYRKVRDRASYAFALVSLAGGIELEGDTIRDVRLALGGVAHKPWRAFAAEASLKGQPATEDAFRAAAEAELAGARGLRDNAFKIELAKRLMTDTLLKLVHTSEISAMSVVQSTIQAVMKKAVALAPDGWIPGGKPDPLILHKHGLIGAPVSRIDGPLKVAGQAHFAAEFPMDAMTYAAVRYSTIAKGAISAIDAAAARAAPGVVLVMTHENAPRLKPTPPFMSKPKAAGGDSVPVMQDERIHWNGQPVALVLAETQEQADHAQALIRVSYAAETAVTSMEAAKARGTEPGVFQGEPLKLEIGEAEEQLAAALHRVDATYTTPRHNHNPIELHAATLAWNGDELYIHDASQAVDHVAWSMAEVFGIEEKQVRVTSPYVGGGFGSKTLWQHQILAAAASKLAGRPVRIVVSREGVFRIVGGRTVTEQRVAIGAGADGGFEALIHTGTVAMTPHNNMPEPFILPARSAYAARSFKLDVETVKLDMVANTFMRAPGESVGTFGLECAVDELAFDLGMDPIELRLRNEPEKDPTTGLPFSARHISEAWRAGAERFGWDRRNATPGARRDGDWLVGMGCATATYPYYRMPGGAARIVLRADSHATVSISAHEMGMGTSTAQTQIAAERLGLTMDQVTFEYGDNILPGTVLAGGSQQTAAIGGAVIAAHNKLVAELLKLAGNDSPLAGLKPEEVGGLDGGLCSLEDPAKRESYTSILARAQVDHVAAEADGSPPLETQHWSMHSHGAMFCEARVNAVTGEVRVTRFLGYFDCGRIINAKTAASQFRGGIVMGLGMALMEETQFDERTGRIMNPSLAEYHVPVHLDVPDIDVAWTDDPDPHTPMGARGVGEIGITGVGAAVANAVFNATGKRIRDLPITLDQLL